LNNYIEEKWIQTAEVFFFGVDLDLCPGHIKEIEIEEYGLQLPVHINAINPPYYLIAMQ
jgi:hypothetical protein